MATLPPPPPHFYIKPPFHVSRFLSLSDNKCSTPLSDSIFGRSCPTPFNKGFQLWRPFMKYCCHVWDGAPNCYLELLDKLTCRTIGPSFSTSLDSLSYCRNVNGFIIFYRYYFGSCSFELTQLVPLPYSSGRSTCYSDRLHGFSVTILQGFPQVLKTWGDLFEMWWERGLGQYMGGGVKMVFLKSR